MAQNNEGPANNYVCNECYKCFKTIGTLSTHMKLHTNPINCPYCEKQFSHMSSNYNTHVSTHTRELNYTCKKCNDTFNTPTSLTRHKLTTHPETIKKMSDYYGYSSLPDYYRQFTNIDPLKMLLMAADHIDNL